MPTFKNASSVLSFIVFTLFYMGSVKAADVPPVLGSYNNVITGTNSGEQLYNHANTSDHIIGLGGNDQLFGLAENDLLEGGDGNDYIDGGEGNDVQLGGAGNDQLGGDAGNDWLSGGLGNDKYARISVASATPLNYATKHIAS
jgi:hypothetical protein